MLELNVLLNYVLYGSRNSFYSTPKSIKNQNRKNSVLILILEYIIFFLNTVKDLYA